MSNNTTVKLMLATVRKHCVECCCGVQFGDDGPAGCTSTECNLYPYRSGKNPKPNPNIKGRFKAKTD